MSDRPECAFELLRYYFGGNRPSQTDRLALSSAQIHGTELERPYTEGGISPMAPLALARKPQRLPPILHTEYSRPIPAYSEAA